MADIDLNSLSYYKTETDDTNSAESTRVDNALDTKVDESRLAAPSGVATLAVDGKQNRVQIPFSDLTESGDPGNNNTSITPERLHYQIQLETVSEDKIGSANGVAPLGSDSIIPSIYLPPAEHVHTFVVETLVEMYNLPTFNDVNAGDRCVVTNDPSDTGGDVNGEYVADVNDPISTDWSLLPNLSTVTSVNGQTGAVDIVSVAESAQNAIDITARVCNRLS